MCTGNNYAERDVKQAVGYWCLSFYLQNEAKNKTPEELKQGLVYDRKCTDVIMCIIFALFFCGMFATAAYGYANGNPQNLIVPFDSSGKKLTHIIVIQETNVGRLEVVKLIINTYSGLTFRISTLTLMLLI